MCVFIGSVSEVRRTRIFANRLGDRQFLVYEAFVDTARPNAMVLPVPHADGTVDDVDLIDLSDQKDLFANLDACFPTPPPAAAGGPPSPASAPPPPLKVHTVGSFEASIVPSLADFSRLDPRFRLRSELAQALGDRYPDHAFIVYQFSEGKGILHPFAFSFLTRYDGIFFPTLHVHDGINVEPAARFDHALYVQGAEFRSGGVPAPYGGVPAPYKRFATPLWAAADGRNLGGDGGQSRASVGVASSCGHTSPSPVGTAFTRWPDFIDATMPVTRMFLSGSRTNADTFADLALPPVASTV